MSSAARRRRDQRMMRREQQRQERNALDRLRFMDARATWINVTTAGNPAVGMIPPHYDTDRETLQVALGTIGLVEPPRAKLLWIRNTLDVIEVEYSEAYLEAARRRNDLEMLGEPRPLPFDASGNLPSSIKRSE